MEELNLYGDLDEFQEQQEKKTKELQELENKYQESLKTIEDLQKENKTLRKSIKTIELNFQSLLDTARAEIRRKNKEIDQLRKEKDDICFRRRPSHKVEGQKRVAVADVVSPENSTQTFKKQDTKYPEPEETFTPQANQTQDDKAENISKPGRDESFKRNKSQEGNHANDNKRLKNSRDDRDYKYSHERHKDHYTEAYKISRQSDERNYSHDRRKYENAERNHKTKSPERHRRPSNRSRSREHHRRDNSPETDKKTAHRESPETSERHRRPFNRRCSRETYTKHDKPAELNKKIDNSNSTESSYSHKTQNSERYNFESRYRKDVNKHSKSTLKSPIGPGDLNSLNDKLKPENKAEIKEGISGSAQNVSNQTETTDNIDQETEKVFNNMTVNLTESDNLHSTNRAEEYKEQPYEHKESISDLKKITNSINSYLKDNQDDQDTNIRISSEEDKTNDSGDLSIITLKQQSSNENQFDKPSESSKRESPLTVEANKLDTPCKVALFNEIFGQSSSVTTTSSSSTKSLFNNIKYLLGNFTSNEVIITPTISPGDCTEASDCYETRKTKICTDNIKGNEMDNSFMQKQSICSETTVNDLTKVMEDGIANEIQSVHIPGLDLYGESVNENHKFKATDTFYSKSLTQLFTKQHLKDREEQRIVKESNEPENDMQNVSENSLQMSVKFNSKDVKQQKEISESKEMQSKAHSLLDNVLELEDIKRNVKQQISLQMSSKKSVKDSKESSESISHLVTDNVTLEIMQSNIKSHEHVEHKTSLDDINKNVKQTLPDNEQPRAEGLDIQIESDFHLVDDKSPEVIKDKTLLKNTNKNVEQKLRLVNNKSPELVKDKTLLKNTNKNVEQKLILQTCTKQNLKDKKEPNRESKARKSIRNLEPVKDTSYIEDLNKTNPNNTLQEPAKQNLEGIQIQTSSHLVPENVTNKLEFVKDKISQNTECIDKEKLSELKTISLIERQNENGTEKEQQIGKIQNIVESIEGEANTKQDDLLYTKSETEKTSPQLNEGEVSISNNRNDDLIVANEENTLYNSSALPVKSLKLRTTQENKEASAVSDVPPHDKVNSAELNNSNTRDSNENSNEGCEENKNENLQQNSTKCSDTKKDLNATQVHETCISGNIPQEESCKIINKVDATKSMNEHYSLESPESAEEYRTEIANSSDKSNPTNCDTINTPLEKQNICEKITRRSKANDKPKDTDNYCNTTQIQEATEPAEEQYSFEITKSANTISDIKTNESIEILSRIVDTKATDGQDPYEYQKSFQEIPRNTATSDKPQVKETFISESIPSVVKNSENRETLNRIELSTTSTNKQYPFENRDFSEEIRSASAVSDSDKTEVQEAHISGRALPEVKNNENVETDRVEAAQYSLENRDFSEEITRSASADNDSDKTEVQEAHISGRALPEVKNNENVETGRVEVDIAVEAAQYPLETVEPIDTDHDLNKTQVQKAHLSAAALRDVENNESKETNREEVAEAVNEQYPLKNQDYSEEITKTQVHKADIFGSTLRGLKNYESIETNRLEVTKAADEQSPKTATTSDEPNDTGNNSNETQSQKAHLSRAVLREIENNESIDTNRQEVANDEQHPKTTTTSDEPNDTYNSSNKTSIKEHARITCESILQNVRSNESMETLNRIKITKATDQEALVENQKILLESGNKNVSEENETQNTSHNDASLALEKHAPSPLEPSKSDNLSHTVTCLKETSLDFNSESYNLGVAAAEPVIMVSDGEQKSVGSESLELKPKLLTESAEKIVLETEKEEIIIINKKKSNILTDNSDRITVNENKTKAQCKKTPKMAIMQMSSVASEKGKDVLEKGGNVKDIKAGDSLMNVKVTESKAKDSRPTTISDPQTHSRDSSMDGTIKPNSAVDFTDQNQNQTSDVIQNQTSKESEVIFTTKQTQSLVNINTLSSPEKFEHGLENAKKMLSSTGHETNSTEAETKLPQSYIEKCDSDKTIASPTFNKPCKVKSNSCTEDLRPLSSLLKSSLPNIPEQIQNKTENIETAKQIEVIKKNISNTDKPSGIIAEIKRNENETITKQKSPDKVKSYPNSEILEVECSPSKRYQHVDDFQKISPALPDSFNTSPTLPSISTSSPTPSNFSGIFSKKSSHLSTAEEDFHKIKKKSLHFSTRPREFIIPAASVLCNVDNLENATKVNKKLHWELLDNKNDMTEIEDDTDIETTDEERHKFKGEIKQEQVTPQESPQQSPKDEQDEHSNPADAMENSQEVNYKATQNMPPRIHKSKQYKHKLSKTIKSYPKSAKVNKYDPVTHSSVIDTKPFNILLPKRQRGRPRKLENLLKATIKAKVGPRILKKRGRKPKKSIEFTESYDNNSTECAEPIIDVVSAKDKIPDTLVSEGECALNVKENEELLAEAPREIRNNSNVIPQQEEEKSSQSSCELSDENKQQISLEDRNPACSTRDRVISNELVIKDVVAGTNKDCDDAGKSLQISTKDGQNSNPESKKISKESNKPVTLPLNNDNNCDDVSTTSGDSENKLLIISDGGAEEINEKQTKGRSEEKLSSNKSKPLERLEERKSASTKKDKKYISLEDIGIKVRPFKGHLSTLRIPKVNKDADQTNAWKLEAYEELDKQQREEKVEQKIEKEMNGSTKTVKVANKDFLSTYRIPKIKRDTGRGKDNLEKTETYGKMPKEEKQESVKENYHENVNKNAESIISNNSKVIEAKSIDKRKHTWSTERSEKSKKTYKQQRDNECGKAGSNIINFDNEIETGKRKLFNLETYNDVDHEDELENAEENKQTSAYAERKLSEPKVSEKEGHCYTGKPAKLRRKSLNLPRKMLLTSSDEEEGKHLKNVDVKTSLERNVLHTKKKASLHRRILDSSCDEDVEEKPTNKTNKPLKQRRKSMFIESTTFETDFHHTGERINDEKLTSQNLIKSTSCSETFDSGKNVDMLSSKENIKFLKTTVETKDSVTMLSVNDSKDTVNKNSLKIRRKSMFIESSSSETLALDKTKLTPHTPKPQKDDDNMLASSNDSIKEHTIKNKNDNIEQKRTKLLKSRRKSMHVEPDCANDQTTSINEASKKEIGPGDPLTRESAAGIKTKSTKRELKEERSKDFEVEPILEQNNTEEPVNTNEITKDFNSSMKHFPPLKPRRKSINHRRILDSSSDDNEPLMKKPLLIVNEIKAPMAATELKTKSRKRRIVKVLSTSRDAINSSANSSLQSENLTQIHSNSPSPFASPLHNHPIFNREVSTQSREFVASMPVTPSQQDDDKKFKEIDSKLHQIFQSPQYTTDYKTNHNTTMDSNMMEMLSTSLLADAQGKSITADVSLDANRENDQSSGNVALNKPGQLPHTNTLDSIKLDMLTTSLADSQGMDGIPGETQPDINQENNQSSVNRTQINESNNTTAASHNCSEIKHLSIGSAEYRFEKVSDNVVNLFISRKRKRKRHN